MLLLETSVRLMCYAAVWKHCCTFLHEHVNMVDQICSLNTMLLPDNSVMPVCSPVAWKECCALL